METQTCWHCGYDFECYRPEGGLCRSCWDGWLDGWIHPSPERKSLLEMWLWETPDAAPSSANPSFFSKQETNHANH